MDRAVPVKTEDELAPSIRSRAVKSIEPDQSRKLHHLTNEAHTNKLASLAHR